MHVVGSAGEMRDDDYSMQVMLKEEASLPVFRGSCVFPSTGALLSMC